MPAVRVILLAAITVFGAACGVRPLRDQEPIDPSLYLPLEDGRSWTYEVRAEGRRFRLRHVRLGGDRRTLEPFGSIRYDFTYGTLEGEEHDIAKSIYARTPGSPSLYYFDAYNWSSWFDPPLPLLPDDPRVGSEWTWAGRVEFDGPDEVPSSASLRIVGEEEVTVPAGVFRALRTEQVHEEPDAAITRWLAPGVGLVKEVQVLRGTVRRSVELTAWSAPAQNSEQLKMTR